MGRLNQKVAIITGALGGQGQVAVARFVAEGARVLASDLAKKPHGEVAKLIAKRPADVAYVGGDVRDGKVLEKIVKAAVRVFGGVDVLFNNHGLMVGKPFLETTAEELDELLAVNLRAPFLLSQLVAREMVKRGGGSIIHNSSVGGIVGFPTMAAYGASKGGLAQLARSMATDLAAQGVRVNAICPGVVDTDMPRRYLKDVEDKAGAFKQMAAMHLMNRLAEPIEIVNVALFLASDEASYMTGAVIPVDGGLTAI
ncbi:MAG: glucose 1-dehydrogenase [Gammaproteobacteria bacterium]|nr:glucose 1-dehydrogenase [Gammaproteobacteria bacterium]